MSADLKFYLSNSSNSRTEFEFNIKNGNDYYIIHGEDGKSNDFSNWIITLMTGSEVAND